MQWSSSACGQLSEMVDTAQHDSDLSFSDRDFKRLAKFAHAEFGITLSIAKKPLVFSRLNKRLVASGATSFSNYLDRLESNSLALERAELVSALTTNVTSFFREKHHFDTLANEALPSLQKLKERSSKLRIWSAGCSSGQEPYSIAMSVLSHFPEYEQSDFKILATDIDPKVIKAAKSGKYNMDLITSIPPFAQREWIKKGDKDEVNIDDSLKKYITFAELNLIKSWPMRGPFDIIFCRNVAIYFETTTQQVLWKRFVDLLHPGGYLFIGHSERVTGQALDDLSIVGVTTYRKNMNSST